MPEATNYDAIVVGTSYGGRFLSVAFAEAGRKVALIERDHLGGTCVNVGCTPTKTMVASAHVDLSGQAWRRLRFPHRPYYSRYAGRTRTQTSHRSRAHAAVSRA